MKASPVEMEQLLRCNNLKCRAELRDRALVTTCSHLYCIDCANHSGLTIQDPHQRICPACKAQLLNPDDIVFNNLHPSDDYKTSVLSGLNPNEIMECAGKALSFWAYQMTQEIVYQEYLCKTLSDKYSGMSVHLDKVINEANAQINALQHQVQAMSLDQDSLKRKNDELVHAFKDKNKRLLQTQELYDKLKRKAMLGQMRDAASDAVISNIEAAAAFGTTLVDQLSQPGPYEQQDDALGQGVRENERRGRLNDYSYVPGAVAFRGHPAPGPRPAAANAESWNKTGATQMDMPSTPSMNRQRVGDPNGLGLPGVPGVVAGAPLTTPRSGSGRLHIPILGHNSPRANQSGFSGVGISSGMKTSGIGSSGFTMPIARPRPIQPTILTASNLNQRPSGNQQGFTSGGTNRSF